MKIILLKEVRGLGHAGDVKEVSDGYALNFLLPRKLASVLTKSGLNTLELQKNKKERMAVQARKDKIKLLKKLEGKKFEIKTKTDETGTLYAKIDAKIITIELNKKGFKVEAEEIKLPEPIKKIGEYEAELNLGGEKVKIKLEVRS